LKFQALSDDGSTVWYSEVIDAAVPRTWDILVDAKPALGGGVWIGIQTINPTVNLAGQQYLLHWRGAQMPRYTTGTIAVTQGSTAVVGTGTNWSATVGPGSFITDGSRKLIGVVKKVNSATSITLETPATWTLAAAAYASQSLRAYCFDDR